MLFNGLLLSFLQHTRVFFSTSWIFFFWMGHRFDFFAVCQSWVPSARFQWDHHVYTWHYNPKFALLAAYALYFCTQTYKALSIVSGFLPNRFLMWITRHLLLPYSFFVMPITLSSNWIHRFTWVLFSFTLPILFLSSIDKLLFI